MYLDNFPDLCFKTKVWKNPFWARLKAWIIGAICELFIYVLGFCLKLRFKDIVWMGYFVIQHVFLPFKVGKTRLIPRSKLITPERNIMSTTKIRKRGRESFHFEAVPLKNGIEKGEKRTRSRDLKYLLYYILNSHGTLIRSNSVVN